MNGPAVITEASKIRIDAGPADDTALGIAIRQRLLRSSYYHLRGVTCDCSKGVITLRGQVPTFFLKQTVQSTVEKIDGVRGIINLVDVASSPMGS